LLDSPHALLLNLDVFIQGGYFFSLVSIVFGTLTAATVSQAADRLDKLRAAAVREVTVFLPLVKRLEVDLSGSPTVVPLTDFGAVEILSADERHSVLVSLLRLLWAHTGVLINGSRADELRSIADGDDELVLFIEVLDAR